MKKIVQLRSNVYIRICLELFLAVIVAIGIEAAFNYSAITGGYAPVQLNQTERNGKLIISKTLDEPTYVKKLVLEGNFEKKVSYTISLKTVNAFGKESDLELSDNVNAGFNQAISNINKKIVRIRVVFQDAGSVSVENSMITNTIQFSKYRMASFAFFIFLAFLLIFEKQLLVQKLEWVYLIAALVIGCFTIYASGPQAVTWDEEVHYREAYIESFLSEVTWNQAAAENRERLSIVVNTGEERILLQNYMNELAQDGEQTVTQEEGTHARAILVYFPMSFMLKLGRILPLSYSQEYALGRIGNLLCCVLINFFAIRLAHRKKILMTVIALMPTVLFQSCMYTYDGIIFSCMSLGTILCYRFLEQNTKKLKLWQICLPLLLFMIGSMAKPVYAPFILFLFPLVKRNYDLGNASQKKIFKIAVGIILVCVIAVLLVYILPIIMRLLQGTISYPGDSRGGETDAAAQLSMILHHPIEFLKMLIHEMFTMDNFRNFGDDRLNHFMASNLMFLNLYVLGTLKDAWSFILLPLLGFLFLVSPEHEEVPKSVPKLRLISGLVTVSASMLVWIAMYLFFTPIGMEEIEGVQARYFLPLIMPVAYLVWNQRLYIKISKERYIQIAMGIAFLLTGVCFYQGVIMGRVI